MLRVKKKKKMCTYLITFDFFSQIISLEPKLAAA